MATQIEYALMAGRAYQSTRDQVNWFPVPQGWYEPIDERRVLSSGFEAGYFQRGNEIVISFAGIGQLADWTANIELALGLAAEQLKQTALYYEQVKAANPTAQITFTGHSLGGGLAALMGVFFNKLAMTFDPAPFRSTASMSVRDSIASYLSVNGGITDADLASFTSDIGFPDGVPPGIRGEDKVVGLSVEGEVLSGIPLFNRIGAQFTLPNGTPDQSGIDLHAQALLTAFEQDDRFRAVSFKLPNMIRLIFDNVYGMWTKLTHILLWRWRWPAVLILMLGVTMKAGAADTVTWKEEVVLHDGGKLIVTRSHKYDPSGFSEIGQGPPLVNATITFTVPGTDRTVTWKSDFGRGYENNLSILALDFLNGMPYIATHPSFCHGYNRWGRPNPPYVFFKYEGDWRQISLKDFPPEFNTNLVVSTKADEKSIVEVNRKFGYVPAEKVKVLNRELTEEYRTIFRSEIKTAYTVCEKLIFSNGKWTSPGGFKAPHPLTAPNTTDIKK